MLGPTSSKRLPAPRSFTPKRVASCRNSMPTSVASRGHACLATHRSREVGDGAQRCCRAKPDALQAWLAGAQQHSISTTRVSAPCRREAMLRSDRSSSTRSRMAVPTRGGVLRISRLQLHVASLPSTHQQPRAATSQSVSAKPVVAPGEHARRYTRWRSRREL